MRNDSHRASLGLRRPVAHGRGLNAVGEGSRTPVRVAEVFRMRREGRYGRAEVEDGDRRRSEDYEELDRLLSGADEALGDENMRGANEALKRAEVKAATMWGEVGQPALPGHTRRLVGLIWAVQEDLGRAERNSPDGLRKSLRELRSRFDLEAHRDADKTDSQRKR